MFIDSQTVHPNVRNKDVQPLCFYWISCFMKVELLKELSGCCHYLYSSAPKITFNVSETKKWNGWTLTWSASFLWSSKLPQKTEHLSFCFHIQYIFFYLLFLFPTNKILSLSLFLISLVLPKGFLWSSFLSRFSEKINPDEPPSCLGRCLCC